MDDRRSGVDKSKVGRVPWEAKRVGLGVSPDHMIFDTWILRLPSDSRSLTFTPITFFLCCIFVDFRNTIGIFEAGGCSPEVEKVV
jgi:hypothetical protein